MTILDDKIVPKVLAVIAKYGKVVTFSVPSSPQAGYDSGSGEAAITSTDYTIKASPPETYDARYADGDEIRVGDAKLIIAASGLAFAPVLGMTVTIDAGVWTVVDLSSLYSGESIAAFEMRIRK